MLLSINTICIYKSVLDSLLYEKLVISIKMSYLLWQNDSMATESQSAKLEVKNLPLAEKTWKLKYHTTLNLFWRPLSLDNSLDNVDCRITTNVQQNAFSNQLEEQSPTWPSQRHGTKWLANNEQKRAEPEIDAIEMLLLHGRLLDLIARLRKVWRHKNAESFDAWYRT